MTKLERSLASFTQLSSRWPLNTNLWTFGAEKEGLIKNPDFCYLIPQILTLSVYLGWGIEICFIFVLFILLLVVVVLQGVPKLKDATRQCLPKIGSCS